MKRNKLHTKIKYYTTSLIKYWINELIIRFSDELVLVYTMAKVGSTSFYSIYKKGILSPVFHFHSLDIEKQLLNKLELKKQGLYPDSRNNAKSILKHIQKKKTKIITLVREPIGRNVSAFFEVLEFYTASENKQTFTTKELFEIFMTKLPHEYPLNWFDDEIKKYTGIDIYQYPFDAENKFQIIEKENIKLLTIRTDATDAQKLAAISKFSNKKIAAIPKLNVAKNKYYKTNYKQFLEANSFSESYINQLLENKYVQHFFCPEEIDSLKSKWS